jgi:hypothetical protein
MSADHLTMSPGTVAHRTVQWAAARAAGLYPRARTAR